MGSFPHLRIGAATLEPKGDFAAAQARYLQPDEESVADMDRLLNQLNIGIVAHFYMDVELQGVLSSCSYPHIRIADSLLMADHAVNMAKQGIKIIIVLGVDFMSENVRAVLDEAGHTDVLVYRVASQEIGCSLAESAEALVYGAWLNKAKDVDNSIHVVYINTSLEVKARSHNVVPTITCTSSNVVQTILQADSEVEDLHIWYGPDTYMGANLEEMFRQFATMSDEEIALIHPSHNQTYIQGLLRRFEYFKQGNCVVHHMFGEAVVDRVRREYPQAFHTAHLEVPGEMFALAVEAQRKGRGVVGSTSNILNFIATQVNAAVQKSEGSELAFVLGTEAGMITSIVRKVQDILSQQERRDIFVDIVFPVASEAVAEDDLFGIVPGVAGGVGCSTAGGCATCPYMKMNSLAALTETLEMIGGESGQKKNFGLEMREPKKYEGNNVAKEGCVSILHMRNFQRDKKLGDDLVQDILSR